MLENIQCLMHSGMPLSEHGAEALFQTACKMIRKDKSTMRVVHDDVFGEVTTDWETASMGTFGGVVFVAHIRDENGDHEIRYLANSDERIQSEDGKWFM